MALAALLIASAALGLAARAYLEGVRLRRDLDHGHRHDPNPVHGTGGGVR